jgi:hypothetical protein
LDDTILALLERALALDLTAFQRIADDTEWRIDDEA